MTAKDFMSTLSWWVKQGTDVRAVHEKVLPVAALEENAEAGFAAAWELIKSQGLRTVGDFDNFERLTVKQAIVTARGFEKYGTDDLADAYRVGYLMFADSSGNDMKEISMAIRDAEIEGYEQAYDQGRLDNPKYAKHICAQQSATQKLQERFGISKPVTWKARTFWTKHYCAALHNQNLPNQAKPNQARPIPEG